MSPSQQSDYLFLRVRRLASLQSAWNNVKVRAKSSRNPKTRAAAAKFEINELRNLRRLQDALRSFTFKFEKQRGVLKGRGPDRPPRPIVTAPLPNRIVQRAILDVCQDSDPKIAPMLGAIPQILRTPTSVGGIPEKGATDAIAAIMSAVQSGARYYIRSDIKDFFTRIPKQRILNFLVLNIPDPEFVSIFMTALQVELENVEEIREWSNLFPTGEIGVPQGSSLSALCANIILERFDIELNGRGITTIRYLDDFVILGPAENSVTKAWQKALQILDALEMKAHSPSERSGKAAKGLISDGFDFLSFRITDIHVAPSRNAKKEFIRDLEQTIYLAKKDIQAQTTSPRRAENRFGQSMVLIDRKVRGWGDSFRATTQRLVFAQLDQEVSKMIDEYWNWFSVQIAAVIGYERRRKLGIAVLSDCPLPEVVEENPTEIGKLANRTSMRRVA